ncbi:MAG: hypothetical protein ACYCOU_15610 [Sulfobacillus sp.]
MPVSVQFGIKLGVLASVIGLLLAIPYLFVGFTMDIVGSGATAWPLILENLVPALLLIMAGSLAARRGLRASIVSASFGASYGLIAGLFHWVAAMAMPHKSTLIAAMDFVAMAHGKKMTPATLSLLAKAVDHPNVWSMVLYNALELALFGVILGWIGAKMTNRLTTSSKN